MNKVENIKKVCRLTDKAFNHVLKKIKAGVTEKELAKEVKKFFLYNDAKLAFPTIVAFGKNAFEIHHKPTGLKLRKNHGFVLLDLGAKVNGYCADMSRTVFFGKANKTQRKIYYTVLEAQQKAVKKIKPGSKAYDIDKISREYIIKKGFDPIPHSLGHGVGKKVHEDPRIGPVSANVLENGTIFTIEPGIYIKGFGGIRIEDVYFLNRGKVEQLTKSPKNLLELI